ncbi:hypothetical protein KP509_30G037100 [Ceratopteris richardii]|nr:hypothetical protein KP509_30G037100 [Ceratopteris richardii]
MYAKCGSLIMAEQVLKSLPNRNVITWTALVSGFALHGHGHDALRCFELMLHEGLSPDAVTFVGVLKACGNIKAAAKGERFHDEIIRKGLLRGNNVLLAALIDMYVKCGCLMKAWDILEENPDSDVFCWTSLIEGYVEQGLSEEALECFKLMKQKGVSPTTVTFASVLKACGSIGAVESGEQIHEEISRQGLLLDDFVLGSALVDMYVKCGALLKAKKARDQLPVHDLVSWTTLIAGYAQQGQNQEALNCFKQMEHFDVSPNEVTFTCILNACSHSGLVEEGEMYFTLMYTNYGIKPVLEHYACMVDLYGRAGLFNLAISFVSKIPFDDYMAVWRSVLKACEKRKDVTIGRWAFEHALQIHNGDAALYDLMSNIYRSAGMQENMESIEAVRAESKSWEKMVSF